MTATSTATSVLPAATPAAGPVGVPAPTTALAPPPPPGGLDITVRTGVGTGQTPLSAFDHALHRAGVADYNLVTLSSVIPTGSRVRHVDAPLEGGHGDLLFCVRSQAVAELPGETAWAGLGWCADDTGAGLFVEHHGPTEASVVEQIEASLADMQVTRRRTFGPVTTALASATCVDLPVCALVLAAYRVSTWHGEEQGSAAVAVADEPDPAAETVDRPVEPPAASVLPAVEVEVPEAARAAVSRVSVEREIDYATARAYYALYRASFAAIETQAVARHMLHESEFLEEMLDPRVHKYVAWDHEGRAVGMTTLTTDLATVPWISSGWFAHHFPEHLAREAVYYFGFALVHPDHQGSKVLLSMIEPMAREVLANRGVVAWDMCTLNNERGFGRTYMALLQAMGDVTITTIDEQTYYAAEYH